MKGWTEGVSDPSHRGDRHVHAPGQCEALIHTVGAVLCLDSEEGDSPEESLWGDRKEPRGVNEEEVRDKGSPGIKTRGRASSLPIRLRREDSLTCGVSGGSPTHNEEDWAPVPARLQRVPGPELGLHLPSKSSCLLGLEECV